MKKITTGIIILAFMMTGMMLTAQPVLENTYTVSANICHLESAGEVYYTMDVVNEECRIYNPDHTLYKTIPLPAPEGYYLYNVQFVSEKLFNDDNLVELVYTYSMYVQTTDSYFYTYETRLINENGSVLLSIPGAGYTSVVETESEGNKFLVYIYDYSVIPYRTQTQVYALPEAATKSEEIHSSSYSLGDPFPNPAGQVVHLPVRLPPDVSSGSLELYDIRGNKVLSYPVSGSTRNVVLPSQLLEPGTYMYHVESEGEYVQIRKRSWSPGKPGDCKNPWSHIRPRGRQNHVVLR